MKKAIFPFLIAGLLLLPGCSEPPATKELTQSHSGQAIQQQSPTTGSGSIQTDKSDKQHRTDSRNQSKSYPTDNLDIAKVQVKLVKAVDGDTISVQYEGKTENVRFLLVDTPETSHPRLGVQPFGPEAKEFTKKMVENAEKLELEFDIGPNRDKYSRLLAYVYADGKMVQEALLEQGLARVAYIYQPNVRYVDKFNDLQKISRSRSLGIWSVEDYAREDGFHPEKQKADRAATTGPNTGEPSSTSPGGCRIKGNINAKGEKIYHTPDSPYYERTKPESWFCSEEEAAEAGFRAPRQ